jgi:tRNA pseudouridine55 synthase
VIKAPRRAVDGILVLDKPEGLSSNQALQAAKRLFAAAKAGHTGTLDPVATGVLPLCFGEATKVSRFLLGADKVYRTQALLGVATDTGDREGQVTAEHPVSVTRAQLEAALRAHTGTVSQVPSMYSAIKHGGEPLYRLARRGEEVARDPREVEIYRLDLLDFAAPAFEVEIHCSKGTYVRTLIADIGTALGCGAHVTALRRTAVGAFTDADAYTLDALRARRGGGPPDALDGCLAPIERALAHLPRVELPEGYAALVRRGQAIRPPLGAPPGWVAIYSTAGAFIGMGETLADGRLAPRRLVRVASH